MPSQLEEDSKLHDLIWIPDQEFQVWKEMECFLAVPHKQICKTFPYSNQKTIIQVTDKVDP